MLLLLQQSLNLPEVLGRVAYVVAVLFFLALILIIIALKRLDVTIDQVVACLDLQEWRTAGEVVTLLQQRQPSLNFHLDLTRMVENHLDSLLRQELITYRYRTSYPDLLEKEFKLNPSQIRRAVRMPILALAAML